MLHNFSYHYRIWVPKIAKLIIVSRDASPTLGTAGRSIICVGDDCLCHVGTDRGMSCVIMEQPSPFISLSSQYCSWMETQRCMQVSNTAPTQQSRWDGPSWRLCWSRNSHHSTIYSTGSCLQQWDAIFCPISTLRALTKYQRLVLINMLI